MRIVLSVIVLCGMLVPTQAEESKPPLDPLDQIVETIATPELLSGVIQAQRPLIKAAIRPKFEALSLNEAILDRYLDLMVEEMLAAYLDEIHTIFRKIYAEEFEPNEIAEMAEFLQTETGSKWARKTPELMQKGAERLSEIGTNVGMSVGPRVLERLEEEGMILFGDSEVVDKLKRVDI